MATITFENKQSVGSERHHTEARSKPGSDHLHIVTTEGDVFPYELRGIDKRVQDGFLPVRSINAMTGVFDGPEQAALIDVAGALGNVSRLPTDAIDFGTHLVHEGFRAFPVAQGFEPGRDRGLYIVRTLDPQGDISPEERARLDIVQPQYVGEGYTTEGEDPVDRYVERGSQIGFMNIRFVDGEIAVPRASMRLLIPSPDVAYDMPYLLQPDQFLAHSDEFLGKYGRYRAVVGPGELPIHGYMTEEFYYRLIMSQIGKLVDDPVFKVMNRVPVIGEASQAAKARKIGEGSELGNNGNLRDLIGLLDPFAAYLDQNADQLRPIVNGVGIAISGRVEILDKLKQMLRTDSNWLVRQVANGVMRAKLRNISIELVEAGPPAFDSVDPDPYRGRYGNIPRDHTGWVYPAIIVLRFR